MNNPLPDRVDVDLVDRLATHLGVPLDDLRYLSITADLGTARIALQTNDGVTIEGRRPFDWPPCTCGHVRAEHGSNGHDVCFGDGLAAAPEGVDGGCPCEGYTRTAP